MLFPRNDLAVVTGGSRGIGRAIALELAAEGASVIVNYVRRGDAAEETVAEIVGRGGKAWAMQADVSVEDDVRRLFRRIRQDHGRLRILVNNAGVISDGFAIMMSLGKWRRVMATNAEAAFLCSREALRAMVGGRDAGRRGGAIVNVASIAGIAGIAGQANYSASKGAMIALTRSLAKEAGPMGVRVNAVAPGFVGTDMIADVPRDLVEAYVKLVPLQRIGEAREVASLVCFLASERASYMTGQCVAVDGGFTY
jgi:3-oxoacyl-[acyl-carrier protein] reductase